MPVESIVVTSFMLTTIFSAPLARTCRIPSRIWRSPVPIVIFPFKSTMVTSPTVRIAMLVFIPIFLPSSRLFLLEILAHRQDRPTALAARERQVVHERPDVEDPPAGGLQSVLGGEGVGDLLRLESLPFVADDDRQPVAVFVERDVDLLGRVQLVPVLDRVGDEIG